VVEIALTVFDLDIDLLDDYSVFVFELILLLKFASGLRDVVHVFCGNAAT
jgi:hypothetical protein